MGAETRMKSSIKCKILMCYKILSVMRNILTRISNTNDLVVLITQTDKRNDEMIDITLYKTAVTIAAVDSPTILKKQADYICDGTNDKTIIKVATKELPKGGIIHLHPGNYNL